MTRIPFHPLLFALFPVLSLFVANSEQLSFLAWLEPALIVLGFAILLWFATNLWLRNSAKSAIITSIFLGAVLLIWQLLLKRHCLRALLPSINEPAWYFL